MSRLKELSELAPEEGRVFAVTGVPPEVGAYAFAKFSRSKIPVVKNIGEISEQQAANFLNTFYFQYGHPSIADLAHLQLAIEGFSIVHAIALWQENNMDGQEGSTRYQDYTNRRVWIPEEVRGTKDEGRYRQATNKLFDTYTSMQEPMRQYLLEQVGGYPAEMDRATADRTLKARAFDRTRYLLPLGTRTGLGLVLSARTAEKIVVRLVSSPVESIKSLGYQIKGALSEHPAFNLTAAKVREAAKKADLEEVLLAELDEAAMSQLIVAPTLIKHTAPSPYQQELPGLLKEAARQYLDGLPVDCKRGAELHFMVHPEIDLAATALYRGSHHSYRQILEVVESLQPGERADLIDLLNKGRGSHDEGALENNVGAALIYDVTVDIGAFRDLWRHRRLVKVAQDVTPELGFDTPEDIKAAGLEDWYHQVMQEAGQFSDELEIAYPGVGQFALPMGYFCRSLYKMDLGELRYLTEIRTKPGGHFSYQEIAWEMYEELAKNVPAFARHIRVSNSNEESFWKR